MKKLSIAAIQMCSRQNRTENLHTAQYLMEQAVQKGARIIALPENFSFVGNDQEKTAVAEDLESGPSISFLKSFASKNSVAIIGGSVPLRVPEKSTITNTCLVFNPAGEIAGRYEKLHLFDFQLDEKILYNESRYIEPGNHIQTIELFGIRMGLSICYDLRFPELYRTMVLRGVKVLFVPSAFTLQTGRDHWETLLRARAIENLCYVVAPAQYGQHNAERISYGRTMIIDPWGRILAQSQDKEDAIFCEIDMEYLERMRERLPCIEHIRRELFFPAEKDI